MCPQGFTSPRLGPACAESGSGSQDGVACLRSMRTCSVDAPQGPRADKPQAIGDPMASYPPSTCSVVPVIPRAPGDIKKSAGSATTEASLVSQPTGADSLQRSAIWSKPGIEPPARDLIGPALMVLTRMPSGPRSRARYRADVSSTALAEPIQS